MSAVWFWFAIVTGVLSMLFALVSLMAHFHGLEKEKAVLMDWSFWLFMACVSALSVVIVL
jgi:hypothetical protein